MKRLVSVVVFLTASVLTVAPIGAAARTTAPTLTQQTAAAPLTLKLTVTISRFQGEKKVGSLPFVMMIVPATPPADGSPVRDGDPTSLQVGSEVPIPSTTLTEGKAVSSTRYQSLGTQIQAMGRVVSDGAYNVFVSVTDNQIMGDSAQPGASPRFQNFRSSNRLILRDGQTVQYTAAADKVSGEVIKLDVTLNVVK